MTSKGWWYRIKGMVDDAGIEGMVEEIVWIAWFLRKWEEEIKKGGKE